MKRRGIAHAATAALAMTGLPIVPSGRDDDQSRMTNPLAVIGGITTTYLHDERSVR